MYRNPPLIDQPAEPPARYIGMGCGTSTPIKNVRRAPYTYAPHVIRVAYKCTEHVLYLYVFQSHARK
jgi:hypothetical protein